MLSLTITTNTLSSGESANGFLGHADFDPFGDNIDANISRDRETVVTQDIPVQVLTAETVEGIYQPRVREPNAHIMLPSLIQLKAVSDRFTKLAMVTSTSSRGVASSAANSPKLEIAANMHGRLKISITTDALSISSVWEGLENPELRSDANQNEDNSGSPENHPSVILKAKGPEAWSTVRIDGREWGRVLSVGRLGGRVIACKNGFLVYIAFANCIGFADDNALVLYVYLLDNGNDGEESVLTVCYYLIYVVLLLIKC